jgi:hypothetical protein
MKMADNVRDKIKDVYVREGLRTIGNDGLDTSDKSVNALFFRAQANALIAALEAIRIKVVELGE